MIKTIQPVIYRPSVPEVTAVLFSKINDNFSVNDLSETYTFSFEEWREVSEFVEAPNSNGEMIQLEVVKKINVRTAPRVVSFAEVEALTGYIEQNFTITETGELKQKRLREIGHLVMKNFELAYGTNWIEI